MVDVVRLFKCDVNLMSNDVLVTVQAKYHDHDR